jgi:hypothetical protein
LNRAAGATGCRAEFGILKRLAELDAALSIQQPEVTVSPKPRSDPFVGPVIMRRVDGERQLFEAECHKCDWRLSEAARYTMIVLDEAFVRDYLIYQLNPPHRKNASQPY